MTHIVKRNFLYWMAVAFLQLVIATPAFAQMLGSTTYSDSWGDENYIYGCGVTDSSPNSYNHTFRAVTTIVSPNGRSASYDTGYGSVASAFVYLTLDEYDLGNFTVNTDHFDYCPFVFAEAFLAATSASYFSPWSEWWYTTDCITPDPTPCQYYDGCTVGAGCGLPLSFNATGDKKWIKQIVPMDEGLTTCYYNKRVREYWDTKFGSCFVHY